MSKTDKAVSHITDELAQLNSRIETLNKHMATIAELAQMKIDKALMEAGS